MLRAFITLFALVVPIGCSLHSTDLNRVRIEYSMDSGYVGINYKVTILGNGKVRYEGNHGVGVPGVQEYFVPPATVQAIVNVLNESPFSSMPKTIPEAVFDGAMIRLEYSDGHRQKTVLDNGRTGVPKWHRGQSLADILKSKETEPSLWQAGQELERLSGAERFIHSKATDYALLIAEGWNVNTTGERGATALDYAVSHRDSLSTELLLDHGALVSYDALRSASFNTKDLKLFKRLVSLPGVSQEMLNQLLIQSARWNNSAACALLLEDGADPNSIFESQKPVFAAVQIAAGACIDELVKHGANLNDRDEQGRTPLMVAAEGNNSGIVAQLIRLGADVGTRDRAGKTALTHALQWCHYWTLLPLLEAGAAPDPTDVQSLPTMDPSKCAPGNQNAKRAAMLLKAAAKSEH